MDWIYLENFPGGSNNNIASNHDTSFLYVSKNGNQIYKSTDYGLSWTVISVPVDTLAFVCTNYDGSIVYTGNNLQKSNNFLKSIDFANYFTETTVSFDMWGISTNKDGTIVYVADNYSTIHQSVDSGLTWSSIVTMNVPQWITTNENGDIYYYTNQSNSFIYDNNSTLQFPKKNWTNLVTNYDGSIIYAVCYDSYIYASFDFGQTYFTIPTPTINHIIATDYYGSKIFLENYKNDCKIKVVIYDTIQISWNFISNEIIYLNDVPIGSAKGIQFIYTDKELLNKNIIKIGDISTYFDQPIISDVCFAKNTLVQTDQGIFPIQSLKTQTIHKLPITVTKTVHSEPYLVKVCAYAFGTFPTKDTYMSMKHKIYMDGPIQAKYLVNEDTVILIPYDGEPLYNILLKEHTVMKVHGMIVETMDPECLVALFYKSKLSPKQKEAMIVTMNKDPIRAKCYLKRYQ